MIQRQITGNSSVNFTTIGIELDLKWDTEFEGFLSTLTETLHAKDVYYLSLSIY